MKFLITGGCGFVGSNLAIYLKNRFKKSEVVVVDNFFRTGSKYNLARLVKQNIKIIKGDIRFKKDLKNISKFNFLIDCAADPSALSGVKNGLSYLLETNINGTLNCLELTKKFKAKLIFLSSSRVYSYINLNKLKLKVKNHEFFPTKSQNGLSINKGISEKYDDIGLKTFYGFTKFSAENLIKEYSYNFDVDYILNRSGVIAGPWQWGRVDQGFMSYWIMAYMFKKNLKYIGYGGLGYQVRDILNIMDLCKLVEMQVLDFDMFNRNTFNIGGGIKNKISLYNLTKYCNKIFNSNYVPTKSFKNRTGDIPYYISDYSKIYKLSKWVPETSVEKTIEEIYFWVKKNKDTLKKLI